MTKIIDKPTFAVLLDSFRGDYQFELVKGFEEEAVKQGVNLIYFIGKPVDSPMFLEKEQNTIYELINKNYVDGIIIAATILKYLSADKIREFCNNYSPIPIAAIGFELPDQPAVILESRKGFFDLMDHLYDEHGFRKFAFIHGPENHPEAIERYKHFTSFLGEKKLAVNDQLTVYGDFCRESGALALQTLVKDRGLKPGTDFEVIVSSNDVMAIGIMDELERLGYDIPGDVAVTGFDNDYEGAFCTPALTTVHQPIRQKSKEAIRNLIKHPGKPFRKKLPAEVIIRRSCGCIADPVYIHPGHKNWIITGDKKNYFIRDKEELIQIVRDLITTPELDIHALTLAENFINNFISLTNSLDDRNFRNSLEIILTKTLKNGGNISYWYRALLLLHNTLQESRMEDSQFLMNVLWQANIQISRKFRQQESRGRLISERYAALLRYINEEIKCCMTLDDLAVCLREKLPLLISEKCYLFFHENIKTEKLKMIMGYSQNSANAHVKQKVYTGLGTVISKIFNDKKRFSCVILPLTFENAQYGIQIAGVNLSSWVAYEDIRVHISSTLKSLYLLKESEEANYKLKEAREQLMETTHIAGMSRVNNNILMSVANILTSANASVDQIKKILDKTKLSGLKKANSLLRENLNNLYSFLLASEKGKLLLAYYLEVGKLLEDENENLLYEFSRLYDKIDKINEVVSTPGETTTGMGVSTTENLINIIESVLFLENNNLQENEITISRDFSPEDCFPVSCRKDKLIQVFVILIENAVKSIASFESTDIAYMEASSGKEPAENKLLTLSLKKNDSNVYLKIIDTGKGIKKKHLKSIFKYDFFDQSRSEWSGLHTCNTFLMEMDAKIFASSKGPGKGTTYKITFPLMPEDET